MQSLEQQPDRQEQQQPQDALTDIAPDIAQPTVATDGTMAPVENSQAVTADPPQSNDTTEQDSPDLTGFTARQVPVTVYGPDDDTSGPGHKTTATFYDKAPSADPPVVDASNMDVADVEAQDVESFAIWIVQKITDIRDEVLLARCLGRDTTGLEQELASIEPVYIVALTTPLAFDFTDSNVLAWWQRWQQWGQIGQARAVDCAGCGKTIYLDAILDADLLESISAGTEQVRCSACRTGAEVESRVDAAVDAAVERHALRLRYEGEKCSQCGAAFLLRADVLQERQAAGEPLLCGPCCRGELPLEGWSTGAGVSPDKLTPQQCRNQMAQAAKDGTLTEWMEAHPDRDYQGEKIDVLWFWQQLQATVSERYSTAQDRLARVNWELEKLTPMALRAAAAHRLAEGLTVKFLEADMHTNGHSEQGDPVPAFFTFSTEPGLTLHTFLQLSLARARCMSTLQEMTPLYWYMRGDCEAMDDEEFTIAFQSWLDEDADMRRRWDALGFTVKEMLDRFIVTDDEDADGETAADAG